MNTFLIVGDVHCTVEELRDCQSLMELVYQQVGLLNPTYVVFLGDQHHTHAVLRIEVVDFWSKVVAHLAGLEQKSIMLIGNHDRSNDASLKIHGLKYETDFNHVVSSPQDISNIRFLSWFHDNQEFCAAVGDSKRVICHSTFNGSRYDNGMFAPEGIDPGLFPDTQFLSGHIHLPQKFANVWHPGAPRWRTASDVNVDRNIYLVDETLAPIRTISTRGFCKAKYRIDEVEGVETVEPEIVKPSSVSVNISGSSKFIDDRKPYWVSRGFSVATFVVQDATASVKESEGITVALGKYIDAYKPKFGTSPEVLRNMIATRIKI
jgi:Calcineurin-like phosphoesterase